MPVCCGEKRLCATNELATQEAHKRHFEEAPVGRLEIHEASCTTCQAHHIAWVLAVSMLAFSSAVPASGVKRGTLVPAAACCWAAGLLRGSAGFVGAIRRSTSQPASRGPPTCRRRRRLVSGAAAPPRCRTRLPGCPHLFNPLRRSTNAEALQEACGLPLGLLAQPLSRAAGAGQPAAVWAADLARCSRCLAYINALCEVDDHGWACSLCGCGNDFSTASGLRR